MSHREQQIFVYELKNQQARFFNSKKVLEIGSLNINGSIREFFTDCNYTGLDLSEGPDVDIVCEGQSFSEPDNSYDVTCSVSCFEHNPFWLETFKNMIRLCVPGGLIFFTVPTTGAPEHGTSKNNPECSPFTIQKGWNYYKNLTEKDFTDSLDFNSYFLSYNFSIQGPDLCFWGIKKTNIFDCFIYFNEKELLELRYTILKDYVDEFVVTEANYTFSGSPKKFSVEEDILSLGLPLSRFKIIQSHLDYLKDETNPWIREAAQRNEAREYLLSKEPNIFSIYSDCDEIIDPTKLKELCDLSLQYPDRPIKILMPMLYGRADLIITDTKSNQYQMWWAPFFCTKNLLKQKAPQYLRQDTTMEEVIITPHPFGWHFSWMGTKENWILKSKSFSHYNDSAKSIGSSSIEGTVSEEGMKKYFETFVPIEGSKDLLSRDNSMLKKYPIDLLPREVFSLSKVKAFLLPEKLTKKIEDTYYSVIIATMWKYNRFPEILRSLVSCTYVQDIVIINNSGEKNIQFDSILFNEKIRIFNFEKNLGVNPAWNFGMKQTKYDKVCILNDDLEFDTRVFEKLLPYYDVRFGAAGLCAGLVEFDQPQITNGSIDIIEVAQHNVHSFGTLMFIDKKNWIDIPEELIIYYGDTFILNRSIFTGKINYLITNMNYYTPGSTTCSSVELPLSCKEEPEIFKKILANLRKYNGQAYPLEVFYYLYIENNPHFSYSFWWIDEQLKAIISSNLVKYATINIAIVMPTLFQTTPTGETFTRNREEFNGKNTITFEEKVKEYLSSRYPFINILGIRDTGEPPLYEGYCLKFIYDSVKKDPNKNILYIHSKGISRFTINQKNWLEILDYYLITQWRDCIKQLKNYDIVSVKDSGDLSEIPSSGNFWWATGAYLATLPDPLNIQEYWPEFAKHERYCYEGWIGVNRNKKVYRIQKTYKNHYTDYCFLENLINEEIQEEIITKTIFEEEYEKVCKIKEGVISEHLPKLRELASQCSSITEFGVGPGHSTRAFLTTSAKLRSYDLNYFFDVGELFKIAKEKYNKDVFYWVGDVLQKEIENTDLLFIDSLHTYNQLKAELTMHANNVNKYIIFHDVFTFGLVNEQFSYKGNTEEVNDLPNIGLLPAILEFLQKNPEWKINYFSINSNGLLVIEREEKRI